MATVSLCMIVKNEEDVLARCLESAADLVDEIMSRLLTETPGNKHLFYHAAFEKAGETFICFTRRITPCPDAAAGSSGPPQFYENGAGPVS